MVRLGYGLGAGLNAVNSRFHLLFSRVLGLQHGFERSARQIQMPDAQAVAVHVVPVLRECALREIKKAQER